MEAKKAVLFGAGAIGALAFEKYRDLVEVIAIADNDPTKWGVHWGGDRDCFSSGNQAACT